MIRPVPAHQALRRGQNSLASPSVLVVVLADDGAKPAPSPGAHRPYVWAGLLSTKAGQVVLSALLASDFAQDGAHGKGRTERSGIHVLPVWAAPELMDMNP